jgi:hypothetical protein
MVKKPVLDELAVDELEELEPLEPLLLPDEVLELPVEEDDCPTTPLSDTMVPATGAFRIVFATVVSAASTWTWALSTCA